MIQGSRTCNETRWQDNTNKESILSYFLDADDLFNFTHRIMRLISRGTRCHGHVTAFLDCSQYIIISSVGAAIQACNLLPYTFITQEILMNCVHTI